jgi:hypothetical protein
MVDLQFGLSVFIERFDLCANFVDSLLVLSLNGFAFGLASFPTLNSRHYLINTVVLLEMENRTYGVQHIFCCSKMATTSVALGAAFILLLFRI